MAKQIATLVQDMESVIFGNKGWDNTIGQLVGANIAKMAYDRFKAPQEPRGYLSMSSIGTPCSRKLWYKVNQTDKAEALQANALLKFFYGDMIEELALGIAQQAGHVVVGQQDKMNAHA